MKYFVKYRIDGDAEKEIELPQGKSIALGGGNTTDIRLTPYFQLPDRCARIWHEDHCLVENLTRKSDLVLLNGRPLHSVALFEHNDVLQIGVDQFKMSIRADDVRQAVPQTSVPIGTPSVPRLSYNFKSTAISPSVTRHTPTDSAWKSSELLTQVLSLESTIIFANFKAAETEPPQESWVGSDLLGDAPDEIRAEHSLHIIVNGPPLAGLRMIDMLSTKDAVVVAIPEREISQTTNEIKLLTGWFVRPSILEVTLTKGSRILCEQLLNPFLGIIILGDEPEANWEVYSASKLNREKSLIEALRPSQSSDSGTSSQKHRRFP